MAVEESLGRSGDIRPKRRQKVVEGQRAVEGPRAVEGVEGRRENRRP